MFFSIGQMSVRSQTVITFHENFEIPGQDDSVTTTSTTPGVKDWKPQFNSSLFRFIFSNLPGESSFNNLPDFPGIQHLWEFICGSRVCADLQGDVLDLASIEVSGNGGITWTQLTGTQYLGTGAFQANGNRFCCQFIRNVMGSCHIICHPKQYLVETGAIRCFSLIANISNAKVRFKLTRCRNCRSQRQIMAVSGRNKGWKWDPMNWLSPVITLISPVLTGPYYNLGPFPIKAKITDASGNWHCLYRVYHKRRHQWHSRNDLSERYTMVEHTVMQNLDVVCWYVVATDNTPGGLIGRSCHRSCNSFTCQLQPPCPISQKFW